MLLRVRLTLLYQATRTFSCTLTLRCPTQNQDRNKLMGTAASRARFNLGKGGKLKKRDYECEENAISVHREDVLNLCAMG